MENSYYDSELFIEFTGPFVRCAAGIEWEDKNTNFVVIN